MYERLKKLLDSRGITPYRLSKDTGIGQTTLSDWKNGRSQPKIDKLIKLANYFDVPITYFIEYIKENEK